MKKLVLIDGHAILYRAYHAFPKTLINRHGQLINAAYGFTRMLFRVIEDLNPKYLVVTFDRPELTFRHREFVGYQAQRPQADKEFVDQIVLVKEILAAFSIPVFEKIGFEADDIIGTLAKQARSRISTFEVAGCSGEAMTPRKWVKRKQKIETIIVTGDKDIFQLINDSTFVYAPVKGFAQAEMFDRKKVKKSLGVWPKQIVDYKALMGDASDNYPGVPGVGPKTAMDLLKRFKSLSGVYGNLNKIRDSVRKKLIEGKESALLSKFLAKIVTNVPVKLRLKNCFLADYDQEKVLELFKHLGFRSLMNKLPGTKKKQKKKKEKSEEQMKLV